MSIVLLPLILILLMALYIRQEMSLDFWLPLTCIILLLSTLFGLTQVHLTLLFIVVLAVLYLLIYRLHDIRKQYLTKPLLAKLKTVLPSISKTEQQAIDAGTVWWDAELFNGNPDWNKLFGVAKLSLTEKEQAFLCGPVEEVCQMCDDWQITYQLKDLPQPVWDYLKQHRFFALNMAKEYGGHGFSAYAQSTIIKKLATRSSALGVTVMVPNSLGPAELLYHYGTKQQKDHYLPRLAKGQEIPCFALTNPWAGSDAEGMPDSGIICMSEYEGKQMLGFRVSWEKRYITLAPVATLLGLAFKAYDPEKLLGDQYDLGITCALLPTDTKGIHIGTRHLPLNAAFQNGPTRGQDVFVPFSWVIGGEQCIGQGWRMLMESLAVGRGISLPAAATGAAQIASRTSGAYARVREQFGLAIGKFEGIEEALARIGGLTYLLDSGRLLMLSGLECGEKPAVMSAIIKQQSTELSRTVINDAMDIHGGKGICMGPHNYLAHAYQQIPIGITVEGANILTRCMIIFGQGMMRCHPWLLKEIKAIGNEDTVACLDQFDQTLVGHLKYAIANKLRAFTLGISRGVFARGYGKGLVKHYSCQIAGLSAAFAYLSDVTLFVLGGKLKRKEMLSGRFADALSALFLASAALKRYIDNGEDKAEAPLVHWACQHSLFVAQQSLDEILRNYPLRWLALPLRCVIFPSGRYLRRPNDRLSQQVAQLLQTDGPVRERLTEHIFISSSPAEIMPTLESAFKLMAETEMLRKKLKVEGYEAKADQNWDQWLNKLLQDNIISEEEAEKLKATRRTVESVIMVDDFDETSTDKI